MNKARIDGYIEKAGKFLKDSGIATDGKIEKTFRGYISAFGAAIMMGSLRSAIAFYSDNGNTGKERAALMKIIYALITDSEYDDKADLLGYVIEKNNDSALKEQICDAAVAVKLAMNMYNLILKE